MRTNAEPERYADDISGDEVSIGDILQVVWRRLWVISLTAVACVILAVAYSLYQTPMYEGTALILVDKEEGGESNALGSDVQGLEQLTQTMVRAINTSTVAAAVTEELGLDTEPEDFLENLTVEQAPETQFVEVGYRSPDPERAAQITNTIGEVFSERISEVNPGANSIAATVWDPAAVPEDPVSPNLLQNGVLSLLIGLMLGTGLAFLLEFLDNSWHSPEEAEQILGIANFGVVPEFKGPKGEKGKR